MSSPAAGPAGAPPSALPDVASGQYSLDDVRQFILAFFSPSTPSALRRQLDRWLEAYRGRREAWAMADQFLVVDARSTPEQQQQLVQFAAITMHSKIRYDFLELPPESLPSLRETLLRHISRLVAGGSVASGMGPVLLRLCLALSSLVVQSPTVSGEEAVQLAGQSFPPPGGTVALLEILTTLAEEAQSRRTPIGDLRRHSFLRGLKSAAPAVLELLQQVLVAGASSGQTSWLERVFRCFTAWVSACELPAPLVAECPLLGHLFEALQRHPALFHAACDAILELLRVYHDPEVDQPVIALLLPSVIALEALFDKAVADEDEDQMLALARLFADAGTTYLRPMIISSTRPSADDAGATLMRKLFMLVIKCASNPEPTVSAATFSFWQRLYDELYTMHG